jgi:transcription elongation factor GreB
MTNIITAAGRRLLIEEYNFFRKKERPRIVKEVSGGQKRLCEIDARIMYLRNRLELLKVAPEPPEDPDSVSIGCWITYLGQDGMKCCGQLVGPDEINLIEDRINIDSAIGKALIGRVVDDEIMVRGINGDLIITIISISTIKS